ncbi:MAG: ATP-binding cassette domain-containing protein [Bacilli bacterium]|nr:ATP-binding cassette domain-containing protein [Bacilli bacterium]
MLEVLDLHKTFHLDDNPLNDKKALQGVNLTVKEGDFITVIGSNGSGKTTLLNLIAGTFLPDEGKIILNDKDITKLKVYQRAKYIGRVFQDPRVGTIADISLFENLSIASRRGKPQSPLRYALTKEMEREFKKVLSPLGLGLEDRLSAPMGTFSGGQRQSVTLLMATMAEPELLLLDEHTAALDPGTAKTVMELTDRIVNESKIPTIMITHNMKDAIKYGNRLIMMDNGKIVYSCEGQEKRNLKPKDLIDRFSSTGEIRDSDFLS